MKDCQIKEVDTGCGRARYLLVRGEVLSPVRGNNHQTWFSVDSTSSLKDLSIEANPPIIPGDEVVAVVPLFETYDRIVGASIREYRKDEFPKRGKAEMLRVDRGGKLLGIYSHLDEYASSPLTTILERGNPIMSLKKLEEMIESFKRDSC